MDKQGISKILICRTDRIGDVILSTPVVSALRKSFPRAKIDFLVSQYAAPVLEGNLEIDKLQIFVPGFPMGRSFRRLLCDIRKEKYDIALNLYSSFSVNLLLFLAGIKCRIGAASRLSSFVFLNRRVRQKRSMSVKNEAGYNLDLATELTGISGSSDIKCSVHPDGRRLSGLVAVMRKNLPDGEPLEALCSFLEGRTNNRIVIMNPLGGGSALNIPIVMYRRIMDKILSERKDVIFLVTGLKIKPLDEFRAIERTAVMDFLTLSDLILLISRASLFIGPSTGTLHIANALNVPIVAFYSPITVQSETRWGPYLARHASVFVPPVNCREKYKCKPLGCKRFYCMEKIDMGAVVSKCLEYLDGSMNERT